MRARRLSGGLLATVSFVLIATVALTAGVTSSQWTGLQETARERLAQIETGITELGGKVLDTASSLAEVEVEEAPTATPTPVVVLAQLPEMPVRAGTLQPDIVLAPTTVTSAVGGIEIEAETDVVEPLVVEEEPVSPTSEPAAATPTATEEPTALPPTATPPPTEAPPTHTPTPTAVPPTPTAVPPTPTPQPVAAAAAATGGGGLTHTVQTGDNWFTIARRYGITQDALAAYNNRRPTDILQVGQVLRVPPAGAAIAQPPPTPTPPRPTAVPSQPTPTPTVDVPPVARLSAPVLLSPVDGDGFSGAAQPVLTWRPVVGFGPQDFYYVLVRFTMRDGQQGFVEGRVTTPSFTVPMWVYDVANTPERLSVWSVQVRREGAGSQDIEVSPPSEHRTFYWR